MKKLYVISGMTGMTGNELARQIVKRGDDVIGFDNFFASSMHLYFLKNDKINLQYIGIPIKISIEICLLDINAKITRPPNINKSLNLIFISVNINSAITIINSPKISF